MRFNSLLNFVSNIRRKVLFATSGANLSRHFFNGNQFPLIPLSVSNGFRNGFTMTCKTFIHNPYFFITVLTLVVLQMKGLLLYYKVSHRQLQIVNSITEQVQYRSHHKK